MPFAILGTGRSGTSMVAGMLKICGLDLGSDINLTAVDEGNPKGYWENHVIYDLNERVLTALGASYDLPPTFPEDWQNEPVLSRLIDEAKRTVQAEFSPNGKWVWKLPRASATLPFWRHVIPDLKVILCVRNPLDYAHSIRKYSESYNYSKAHTYCLWQFYNLTVLQNIPPSDLFVTNYERYFPHFKTELGRLLDFIGISRPKHGSEKDVELGRFHESDLKHHNTTLKDVLNNRDLPEACKTLYEFLLSTDKDTKTPHDLTSVYQSYPFVYQAVCALANTNENAILLRKRAVIAEANHRAAWSKLLAQEQEYRRIFSSTYDLQAELQNANETIGQYRTLLNSRSHRLASISAAIYFNLRMKFENFRASIRNRARDEAIQSSGSYPYKCN